MRKNILYLMLIAFAFASCDEKADYEVEYSKTVEYGGDWYYEVYSADMNTKHVGYGEDPLLIYNTAADVDDEIWIDDEGHAFPMKFKAKLDGDLTSFSSDSSQNLYYDPEVVYPSTPDTADIDTAYSQSYKRYEVLEGQILSGMAKTKDGNVVDSLFLKIRIYMDQFTFKSELDEIDTTWEYVNRDSTFVWDLDTTVIKYDPDLGNYDQDWVKINDTIYHQVDTIGKIWSFETDTLVDQIDTTFKWIQQPGVEEVTEEYVVSGHRYSGFLEDLF